jgi:hypothetical protein
MDCDFELDSLLYNCYEIDDLDVNGNKLRVAFIASTYHCGYLLNNIEQINFFELSVYNQDDEAIPDFSEFILNLQFIKHKRMTKLEVLMESLIDYVKQIYLLISQIVFPR